MTQLSRAVLLFVLLMFSPAFKGLLVIMATGFECFTTSGGLAPMVFKRLGLAMEHGGASASNMAWFAISVCIFFAFLTTMSISVASFHRRRIATALLSTLSAYISFRGVSGDAYANVHSLSDFTLELWLDTVYYVAFAVVPLVYITMNSNLVVQQFSKPLSKALDKFNVKMGDYLENVIDKNMETAQTVLDVKSDNEKARASKKRKAKAPEKSPIQVGATTNFDELFSNLNDN